MKFENLQMRTRLGLGYSIVLLLLIAVALAGYIGMSRSNDALHHIVDVNVKKIGLLDDMSQSVHIISRVVRTIALLHDEKEADTQRIKITEAREKYGTAFSELQKLPLDEAGKAFVAKIGEEGSFASSVNDKFLALAKTDQVEAVQLLLKEGIPTTGKVQSSLSEFTDLQKSKNKHDEETASAAYQTSLEFMLSFTIVAVLFGSFISWYITRSVLGQLGCEPNLAVAIANRITEGDLSVDIQVKRDDGSSLLFAMKKMRDNLTRIVGEVRSGTDKIAVASSQIAAGNLDLSSRTEQQAASLEETASSMEELTGTVKQNADNSRQASQYALSASNVAVKGGEVVAQVVDTMAAINDSARKIVDIIGVIDGIAFQTNILALNAAVEAARAGEQGRGFAVVAAEVRNLAQRSAGAAKEIKTLIGDSVEKVDAGSKLVDQAGATMKEVVESVKRVSDIINEITSASGEQSAGIEQINKAIVQMDEVTQQNAALVEQAAAAAGALQDQAGNLVESVNVFKLESVHAGMIAPSQEVRRRPPIGSVPVMPIAAAKRTQRLALAAATPKRTMKATVGDEWESF